MFFFDLYIHSYIYIYVLVYVYNILAPTFHILRECVGDQPAIFLEMNCALA